VRRPAGNRHVIAFFEKNGLQHGELELRHQQQLLTIKQLEWNCDSTVLAICAQDQERKFRLFILFANLDLRRQLKGTWDFCRNWFLIDPLHYHSSRSAFSFEFAEIFVIEKQLPDSVSRIVVDSLSRGLGESPW
jgi:hypothetical protein